MHPNFRSSQGVPYSSHHISSPYVNYSRDPQGIREALPSRGYERGYQQAESRLVPLQGRPETSNVMEYGSRNHGGMGRGVEAVALREGMMGDPFMQMQHQIMKSFFSDIDDMMGGGIVGGGMIGGGMIMMPMGMGSMGPAGLNSLFESLMDPEMMMMMAQGDGGMGGGMMVIQSSETGMGPGQTYTQSFMSSKQIGPDGKPIEERYYSKNLNAYGPDGKRIVEKKEAFKSDLTGEEKLYHEERLDDQGRRLLREKSSKEEDLKEHVEYKNIEEGAEKNFESKFKEYKRGLSGNNITEFNFERRPEQTYKPPSIEYSVPRFENPGARFENPGPRFENPEPRFENSGARFENPGPRYENPGPRFENPGPRFENPGKNPEPKVETNPVDLPSKEKIQGSPEGPVTRTPEQYPQGEKYTSHASTQESNQPKYDHVKSDYRLHREAPKEYKPSREPVYVGQKLRPEGISRDFVNRPHTEYRPTQTDPYYSSNPNPQRVPYQSHQPQYVDPRLVVGPTSYVSPSRVPTSEAFGRPHYVAPSPVYGLERPVSGAGISYPQQYGYPSGGVYGRGYRF